MTRRMKYEVFEKDSAFDIWQVINRKHCLKERRVIQLLKRIIGLYVKNFGNRKKVFDRKG